MPCRKWALQTQVISIAVSLAMCAALAVKTVRGQRRSSHARVQGWYSLSDGGSLKQT
jgi:hypothetical protein